MRIAASTTTTRELPLLEVMDLVRDLGYAALEVWTEHLWDQGFAPLRLRSEAAARGLALTLHGPARDLNVTSTNSGIRTESQRQYLAALEEAAEMGAEVVVLHPGALSSNGDDPDAFWPPMEAFFGRVAERAALLGLRVGIENMERKRLEIVTDLHLAAGLVRRIGAASLGLTLDVAHVLYNGDPVALGGFEQYIYHVHISGSTHEKAHVPLAQGIFDARSALEALRRFYGGTVAIESFERNRAREVLAENHRVMAAWLDRAPVG